MTQEEFNAKYEVRPKTVSVSSLENVKIEIIEKASGKKICDFSFSMKNSMTDVEANVITEKKEFVKSILSLLKEVIV